MNSSTNHTGLSGWTILDFNPHYPHKFDVPCPVKKKMQEGKISESRISVDGVNTEDASTKRNVTIPFTVSASEPNTIILHHPQSVSKSTFNMQTSEQRGTAAKHVTFPLVSSEPQPQPTLPEVRPQMAGVSLPSASTTSSSKSTSTKLLSSTELISTNSFSRCSKKVTDKGITFEIKAESKPKSKKTSSPPTASITHVGSASMASTSFQRTFYVPPGEDVQKATERVVSQITAELNKQAASQLAQGHTPDKETVIEITRIAAPGEGYFSRENVQKASSSHGGNQATSDNKHKSVQMLHLSPEKTAQKTPPQNPLPVVTKQDDRTPSPPSFQIINFKQGPCKNVTVQTPSKKNEQNKFSGSSVQFKTKFNTAPISMPLISSIGSHSSVNSINKRPLQVIVPQPRKLCSSQANVNSKPNPPKLMSTATIQNGRLQTVIQPITTVASTVIPSTAPLNTTDEAKPAITPFLCKDKVLLKPGIPFPVSTSLVRVKQEPQDVSPISQFSQSSISNTFIQPATTLHTVTLDGTSIKKENKVFDPAKHDDSLTNIQWLGLMSGENLVNRQREEAIAMANRDIRIIASDKQIEKISKECGKTKRPPYSYMHLIQMAISSKNDKKMTLKEIYKWIEDKFPYYKHCNKQGWKNSIRHNLSLYDIFVREKSTTPGQTGTSYWTLRSDVSEKSIKGSSNRPACPKSGSPSPISDDDSSMASPILQIIDGQTSPQLIPEPTASLSAFSKIKKGPAPLLPKPPPMQAYALIPIQNGLPVQLPGQTMVLPSWPANLPAATVPTASSLQLIKQVTEGPRIKRSGSPMDTSSQPYRKQVKIAPKILSNRCSSSQPSRPSSCAPSHTASRASMESPTSSLSSSSLSYSQSLDTTDLQSQLSGIKFDSGIDMKLLSDLSSSSELSSSHEKPGEVKPGLPKPKMYKNRRPRKDPHTDIRHDSSEKRLLLQREITPESSPGSQVENHGEGNLISSAMLATIEKEFSSPMRILLQTPPQFKKKKKYNTSTPTENTPESPGSWISPIHGLTPINSDDNPLLDSGIFTPNDKMSTSTPNRDGRNSKFSFNLSPKLGSLRDLGLPGLTPFKTPPKFMAGGSPDSSFNLSNHSFTKLLGEFHLDSVMEDGIPLDMDNLSFSALDEKEPQ